MKVLIINGSPRVGGNQKRRNICTEEGSCKAQKENL